MEPGLIEQFRSIMHKPNGIILVTGPTGSGKTTTLYSALNELYEITDKIITCEDPIPSTTSTQTASSRCRSTRTSA